MPSIFGKSGSTAGRAKARHKSIRGTISAPIPIPQTPDDDEFPIRKPGSAKASVTEDDFPLRASGTNVAAQLSGVDGPGPSPDEPLEQQPEDLGPSSDQQAPENQQAHDREPSPGMSPEFEQQEPVAMPFQAPVAAPASISGGSGASRTDLATDIRPEPPSTPPPAPPNGSNTSVGRPASRPASQSPPYRSSPRRSSPRKSSPLAVSPSRVEPPVRRATNPALSNVRYSVVSDAPSKQTTQSKGSPSRKKSTLRSALGRLFGRGKKKAGTENQEPSMTSDPTALSRPNHRSPNPSASLTISEFDRPLRSHSIGPGDIMAIESARNSLQADTAGLGAAAAASRRRAATTGGHTLLRPHLFNREYGAGLSPRPVSAHGRASRTSGRPESDDPNEIGRAITSDSSGGLRRRSRSLSGLQDLAIQPGGRRRSDEIRYWRESYDPGFLSPLSSNAQDDVDDTGMLDVSAPESPAVDRPPKTPPQPFNFGLLSKEMMGMKITHAADMDMRLENLEFRALRMERVVEKLCHAVPDFQAPTDLKEPSRPSSSRRWLETDTKLRIPFPDIPPQPSGSLRPPSSPTTNATSPLRSAFRPTSTSTMRGALSLPSLGREPGQTAGTAPPQADVIAQLRSDLDAERAARTALEAQVKKLSDRVNTLSTTMFAMIRSPSESRSNERLAASAAAAAAPSTPGSLLQSPKTLLVPPPPQPPQEQLSVFETDDDDDDDVVPASRGKPALDEEGDVTEDDFQTPREERTPLVSYGAFGPGGLRVPGHDDEDDDVGGASGDEDDPKRKKAARTLSLGQLTLGKGQRARG
ncbi:hypothetical protein C8A05DRAFT_43787 [Staphylotrichum tortipilum]|uniref:Uncharacterized protein n=1 Tax=Staphylotrichum tortipilum TaxID=2831512 RepID=A0AAN6ML35_9PEZI|nr:hypothetical protein C8A05DRAFT_43787 [Staphylotrichum longicolle]